MSFLRRACPDHATTQRGSRGLIVKLESADPHPGLDPSQVWLRPQCTSLDPLEGSFWSRASLPIFSNFYMEIHCEACVPNMRNRRYSLHQEGLWAQTLRPAAPAWNLKPHCCTTPKSLVFRSFSSEKPNRRSLITDPLHISLPSCSGSAAMYLESCLQREKRQSEARVNTPVWPSPSRIAQHSADLQRQNLS